MTWTEHRNKAGDRWLESGDYRINRIPTARGPYYEAWCTLTSSKMADWDYIGRWPDLLSAEQAVDAHKASAARPRIDAAPDPVGKAG